VRNRIDPYWEIEVDGRNDAANPDWQETRPGLLYAFDAATAAADWGQYHDSDGDYTILSGHPARVRVRAMEGGEPEDREWRIFTVRGESVPHYSASEERHSGYTQP
jgi:hypothetical protein